MAIAITAEFEAVVEIPRQYRWTRKASPSEASAYILQGMAILDEFEKSAKRNLWNEKEREQLMGKCLAQVLEVFSKKAEQVRHFSIHACICVCL
jgi:hypothetical protein